MGIFRPLRPARIRTKPTVRLSIDPPTAFVLGVIRYSLCKGNINSTERVLIGCLEGYDYEQSSTRKESKRPRKQTSALTQVPMVIYYSQRNYCTAAKRLQGMVTSALLLSQRKLHKHNYNFFMQVNRGKI